MKVFHWAIVWGKIFVWVVGSCLAVSGHEVLVGIDV